ncbi:MAG: hypothetical protein ACUVRV_12595 [Cyanobacteriota bacterium]
MTAAAVILRMAAVVMEQVVAGKGDLAFFNSRDSSISLKRELDFS